MEWFFVTSKLWPSPRLTAWNFLRATRAHFGQLFMLYSDPGAEIEGLLATVTAPDIETTDENCVSSQVWRVSDPGLIDWSGGRCATRSSSLRTGIIAMKRR